MMKTLMKALLTLTLTFGAAQANDSSFGGKGAMLLPIKNHNITMVDEHIVLEAVHVDSFEPDYWKATCTFHFKNETSEPQKITMGFPFQRGYEHFGDSDESWKEKKKSFSEKRATELELPQARNFTTKVRGVDVKPREIQIDEPNSPYHKAFVWDVEFAPGETIEVINTYEHDTSGSSMSDRQIHYVLLTGKNWKGGKIGRSQLEVRPKEEFLLDFEDPDSVQPKGARIESDGQYKKIVWDLKDFTPKTDLYVNFYSISSMIGGAGYFAMADEIAEHMYSYHSCKDLRIARNNDYAWYGYPFKSADLKRHYKKQWWYKEDPDFDLSKLSKEAQEAIIRHAKMFSELEKKKRCRK